MLEKEFILEIKENKKEKSFGNAFIVSGFFFLVSSDVYFYFILLKSKKTSEGTYLWMSLCLSFPIPFYFLMNRYIRRRRKKMRAYMH